MTSSNNNPKPNTKIFLVLNYKAFPISIGFEERSISNYCWATAAQNLPREEKSYLSWNFCSYKNLDFWAVILIPDMLEAQSRSPKTGIIGLV